MLLDPTRCWGLEANIHAIQKRTFLCVLSTHFVHHKPWCNIKGGSGALLIEQLVLSVALRGHGAGREEAGVRCSY
jgi:hypothetical protein